MNIFASSPSPTKSAIALDNKRLVKMVLETCQLLSTAMTLSGGTGPYKPTHKNHPCSIWARESSGNYYWLVDHFDALLKEYTRRYGRTHKCQAYRTQLFLGGMLIQIGPFQDPPNCTIYKTEPNVYTAYQMYLKHKWDNDKRPPKWEAVSK